MGINTVWAFSLIKFQADMGILLECVFVVKMLGALILLFAAAAVRSLQKSLRRR
ncbi:RND family transporter [Pseudomonas sp. S60]|nr:hypothetical protein [Pseudomonas sp. S60]MBK5008867.1 RND family transporter [Pseudomonas sp. S60]